MVHTFSNTKRPIIGITCNYDDRETIGMTTKLGVPGQDWNYLAGDCVYFIEHAGGTPVIIPQCAKMEDLVPLLEKLDGVLISGGHDVGPENYGAVPKGYCGTIMPMRDRQDIFVARYMAIECQKPVLGICRGVQVLNTMAGGKLYQDLEIEGSFEHHFGSIYPRNVGWHTVELKPGSWLSKIYGREILSVNSFHHQAVKTAGSGMIITAVSGDGVIEAIESSGDKFVVGVQWHPEMMYDSPEQHLLARAFVEECQNRSRK